MTRRTDGRWLMCPECRKLIADGEEVWDADDWAAYHRTCPMPTGPGRWLYRGYHITQHYTLGPFAFTFQHEDYDGAPDAGDDRYWNAQTFEGALEAIDERIEEEAHGYGRFWEEEKA
jgi:hypothetical protein